MDAESAATVRDAFLFDVHRQFEGLARWVARPASADVWEDGREAVLAVKRDGHEILRFTASFDFAGDDTAPVFTARLSVEQQERGEDVLVLEWRGSLPEQGKGLDSRAGRVDGEYADAAGSVIARLREKLVDALNSHTSLIIYRPVARAIRLASPPAEAIDLVPAPPGSRAQALAATTIPEHPLPEFDISVIERMLGGRENSRAVRRYIAAVEGNLRSGHLDEKQVAALIEQGLRAHYTLLRAEITGRSFSTALGVAIKNWSRPAALGVAILVEFVAGVFGIRMIVGENYSAATAGLSLVQSILFGLGLSQVSRSAFEKKTAVALLAAWSAGVTLLMANNPELKHLAQQNMFQLEQPAAEALTRLKRAKVRQGRVEGDVAQSREHQRGVEGQQKVTRAVVRGTKTEVTEAIARRNDADDEIASAEQALATALANDPSEKWAILTLVLLFGSASLGSGLYLGRYLANAEEEHARAVGSSRERAEARTMLAHLRDYPEAVAAEFFGALKGLYADVLQARGLSADEALAKANKDFGEGEAVRFAAARFAGKKYKPRKTSGIGLG